LDGFERWGVHAARAVSQPAADDGHGHAALRKAECEIR